MTSETSTEYNIQFSSGILKVGKAGEQPFIDADIPCIGAVKFIGIGSGEGNEANFYYCG